MFTSLFAVDPSLTSSGWALFSLKAGKPTAAGIITPPGTELALADRLETLQKKIRETLCMLNLGDGDVLVCEGPAPLVLNPNSSLKVEQVRSIFEAVARDMGMRVPGRLNPRTVQSELLGLKGPQIPRAEVKKSAREVASRLFNKQLAEMTYFNVRRGRQLPQDIVDALLVGSVASSRIQLGVRQKLQIEEVFLPKPRANNGSVRARWTERDILARGRKKR